MPLLKIRLHHVRKNVKKRSVVASKRREAVGNLVKLMISLFNNLPVLVFAGSNPLVQALRRRPDQVEIQGILVWSVPMIFRGSPAMTTSSAEGQGPSTVMLLQGVTQCTKLTHLYTSHIALGLMSCHTRANKEGQAGRCHIQK
jgi:hypothetical protein